MKNFRFCLSFCFTILLFTFSHVCSAVVGNVQFFRDGSNGIDSLQCLDDVAETSDGRFLFAISFCDDAINVFERNESGTYDFVSATINDEAEQGVSPADLLLISPDDQNLYVGGTTRNGDGGFRKVIFVYDLDANTGEFTFRQIFEDFTLLGSFFSAVMSSDGRHMYMITVDGVLRSMTRAANGVLSRVQTLTSAEINPGFSERRFWDIELNPDESEVFVSSSPQSVIRLSRDNNSGLLTLIDNTDTSEFDDLFTGEEAQTFSISPEGNDLYGVFSQSPNDTLVQLLINEDGSFSKGQTVSPELFESHPNSRFFCPEHPLISENGRLLYLIDSCSDDIQIWGRDLLTGELSFFGLTSEEENGIERGSFSQLNRPRFSNDGRYIFSAAIAGLAVIDVSVDNLLDVSGIPESLEPGESFSMTIDVENFGRATSHNTEIEITLGDFSVNSATISGSSSECIVGEATVVCSVFEIDPGAAERVTLSLDAPSAPGDYDLEISSTQDQIDISTEDNFMTSSVEVAAVSDEEEPETPEVPDTPEEPETPVEPETPEEPEEQPVAETPAAPAAESDSDSGGGSSDWYLLGLFCALLLSRLKLSKQR